MGACRYVPDRRGNGAASVGVHAPLHHATPVHRAGMAASVEEVSYEFGGLLAVAILGSLLSALYTSGSPCPKTLRGKRATTSPPLSRWRPETQRSRRARRGCIRCTWLLLSGGDVCRGCAIGGGAIVTRVLLRHLSPGVILALSIIPLVRGRASCGPAMSSSTRSSPLSSVTATCCTLRRRCSENRADARQLALPLPSREALILTL